MTTAWSVCRLSELAAPTKGAMAGGPFGSDLVTADYVEEGVPVIRGVNLPFGKKISLENLVYVSETKADALHLNCARPGDLVFTQRGTLGQVGILPEHPRFTRYLISQSQMKMTVDRDKADPLYLYYYFRLPSSVTYIENHALQSGVPHINLGILRKLEVIAPLLPVQKKIAAILTAYDDLIANNQRRVVLLESMAEEIYREWFVRMRFPGYLEASTVGGLPIGWALKRLSEVANINAHSIRRGTEPEFIAYLDISAAGTNTINEPVRMKFKEAPGRARRLARDGDMIWSSVRPGNKTYCLLLNPPDDLVVSTGFAVISPKPGTPFSYLSKAVTTQEFTDQMVTVAKGAAYPATSFDDFEKAQLVWPTDKLLTDFHNRSAPMFRQAALLREQSLLLAKQRDAILPRLISGKLRVDHLDIQYPPSMVAELAQAT